MIKVLPFLISHLSQEFTRSICHHIENSNYRHYVTSPHFSSGKLPALPYTTGESYQTLSKDRSELLQVNQNPNSEPQLQQLQIQVQLQQQSATSPQHHHQQQQQHHHHQGLLSPGLSFSGNGTENDFLFSCSNLEF